jgi:Histone methylation protein DOT1
MPFKHILDEILYDIETIGKDEKLFLERNFNLRLQAIDYLEFHVMGRIEALIGSTAIDRTNFLNQYADQMKSKLEDVDARMFQQLRWKISQEGYRGNLLLEMIGEHVDYDLKTIRQRDAAGYDNLDMFLNGLLTYQLAPDETKDREPEMVFYQKTPARIVLELIRKAEFKPEDVFFDLGSGLGQVVILVNLLTSVISKGVEVEPAFDSYAKACAEDLNLTRVNFINIDARDADYSLGTIFFMYTPFEGQMLQDVLRTLKGEARKRRIRIFTYGPCTPKVAGHNWLIKVNEIQNGLSEFLSIDLPC